MTPNRATGEKRTAACSWAAGVAFCLLVSACTTGSAPPKALGAIAPLRLPGQTLTVVDVSARVTTPDLLETDPAMREFVRRYTAGLHGERQRLQMLHRAVKGPGMLGLRYEPFAEGSAVEVFHRGSANCLSYANLFVALAREAGLDADYQWLEVRPQWTRMGDRVAVSLHVNVVVDTGRGERFMVDIDPLEPWEISGSRRISDRDAQALYHNNLAMQALAEERTDEAWLHLVRALQLSPEMSHLWVNLGAIYRLAGQYADAEAGYLRALQLAPGDRSAMANLVVLYDIEGREEESRYWGQQVERYRESNPYYHAWLGEQAADANDWSGALDHFRRALRLSPREGYLLYATGVALYHRGDLAAASDYLSRAVDAATLVGERESYRQQLDAVRRELP